VRVAVFADVHAHGDALEAVTRAAVDADVGELWSLGDIVGSGPDPVRVTELIRRYCAVALAGNHDYGVTGSRSPAAFGAPGSLGRRSLELAAAALDASGDLEWLRSRKPAARRHGVQCWHASPRHPVREYVTPANAEACLLRQRAPIGLVGHTHEPAAWHPRSGGGVDRIRIIANRPLDVSDGKWLLNPGAVGAPFPVREGWWQALEVHARSGAWWLELDLGARHATWRRAPFDPAPARERARVLGLDAGHEALRHADEPGTDFQPVRDPVDMSARAELPHGADV
jgi:predicted phosphodiesterase